MPQTLADLESQRSSLLQQFLTLGDFPPAPSTPWRALAENPAVTAPSPTVPGIRSFVCSVR